MSVTTQNNNQNTDFKLPPYSLEAEQSVLGSLMMDSDAWNKVDETLVEADFYRHDHQLIFRAMATLASETMPLDAITVSEYLDRNGHGEETGGLEYLADLTKNTPSAANVRAYAEVIRERAMVREMITAANQIADAGYNPEGRDSSELVDFAESTIFRIAEKRTKQGTGPKPLKPLLESTLDRINQMQKAKGGITGTPTGFTTFDKMTTGLQPADLIIVAGRPSMGKTTFAMNIAEHVAVSQETDKPVLIFSMEMPAESLIMRSLSSLARVDQSAIRSGQLKEHDWTRIISTFNIFKNQGKMYIDDTGNMSPSEVRSRARRVARENGGLSLIVLDYLQLMHVPGKSDNRVLEVSEISRSLKALAKELEVPVIALSQLNRSLEQRSDRRPVMADLRESGAIEQDADLITFIYRDEVYNKDTEHKGMAEIIIGKQRNGPIGTVNLTFQGKFTRFDNYADPEMHEL
jgi:replicative DNA helicase